MTTILFFGRVGEAAGKRTMECDAPQSVRTIGDLIAWLGQTDEAIAAALAAPGLRIALDQEFAEATAPIAAAREIAFMAPLSGG